MFLHAGSPRTKTIKALPHNSELFCILCSSRFEWTSMFLSIYDNPTTDYCMSKRGRGWVIVVKSAWMTCPWMYLLDTPVFFLYSLTDAPVTWMNALSRIPGTNITPNHSPHDLVSRALSSVDNAWVLYTHAIHKMATRSALVSVDRVPVYR